MSLEAAAGKNPATHVGKIYNVVARDVAETLVATMPEIIAAQCMVVSQIGSPVTKPAMIEVKLATRDGFPVAQLESRVAEIAAECLANVPKLVDNFMLA